MSLAYKLYCVGNALTEEDVLSMVRVHHEKDANFIVIDFDENFQYAIKQHAIAPERCFYTQKTGGSGEGIYYLYPNIFFEKDTPCKHEKGKFKGKYKLLVNTLNNASTCVSGKHAQILQNMALAFDDEGLFEKLSLFEKADYFMIATYQGKTIYELMPEIWEHYYRNPCTPHNTLETGLDAMTGKEHKQIGFNPNVKIFTMDNYHDSLKHRMLKNLPFSQESARAIRFGWQFIYENLLYRYNGLHYIIIPSLVVENGKNLRDALMLLKESKENERKRINALKEAEDKIKKTLEGFNKRKNKKPIKSLLSVDREAEERELQEIQVQLNAGMVETFSIETKAVQNHVTLTLDIFFITFSPTDKSFSIQGSIEEILPSTIAKISRDMDESKISDKVALKGLESGVLYLRDYFNRDELRLTLQSLDSKKKHINTVYQERIGLAKLLLEPITISHEALYNRFMYHREYDYEGKKRITDKGTKEWIEHSEWYAPKEQRVLDFLKRHNKLRR